MVNNPFIVWNFIINLFESGFFSKFFCKESFAINMLKLTLVHSLWNLRYFLSEPLNQSIQSWITIWLGSFVSVVVQRQRDLIKFEEKIIYISSRNYRNWTFCYIRQHCFSANISSFKEIIEDKIICTVLNNFYIKFKENKI